MTKAPLSYETLAAAYELRHGFDEPTPWKYIAREFGVTVNALQAAIRRLERRGLNADANGEKPLSRPTRISDAQLTIISEARRAGNTWPRIAAALALSENTVKSRWRRHKLTRGTTA